MRYPASEETTPSMNLLIRDVPDDVVAAIDARARRLGLSRNEVLRRHLLEAATITGEAVTVDHLRHFAQTFADLNDVDVMAQAWR